jgi:surfeit locus 1 family protein
VDRGWIPAEDFQSGNWGKYDEPGAATVQGVIRSSQAIPDFGPRRDPTAAPGDPPLKAWNFVNIPAISQQISYPLLPVYIQEAPDPAWDRLPARTQPQLELTEGPHMGYAIQWFTFAAILGIGYPFFIRRKEREALKKGYPKQFYKEVLVSTNGNGNGHKEEDLEGLRRRQ